MRLIDADALNRAMCHEAFETDSEMQKWDSGCWIRFKMFEKAIKAAPTIEAVPVVRCKDCRFYPDGEGTTKWEPCCDTITPPNWFCADEQREYEMASDERDYCERYEPTYNPEDGSM